jgi:hypothetical protein
MFLMMLSNCIIYISSHYKMTLISGSLLPTGQVQSRLREMYSLPPTNAYKEGMEGTFFLF